MKVVLLFIAIGLVISQSLPSEKQPWECGISKDVRCLTDQTCCRGPNGWACMAVTNGVCCSNGAACEKGYLCNVQENKCDRKPLIFLDADESTPAHSHSISPIKRNIVLKGKAALDFAEGVVKGLEVFNNLPHQSECNPFDDAIAQNVVELVNLIKNVTLQNLAETIKEATAKVQEIIGQVSALQQGCQAYGQELTKIAGEVKSYMSSADYFQKITTHIVTNLADVIKRATSAVSDLEAEKYELSGEDFGGLAHFIALYDFVPQP
jgi:hypothetical protein